MKLIVIGGNPAGLSAASAVRREHADWDIMVYEMGNYISYGSCGLPYYVYGLVEKRDNLMTLTPEILQKKRNIPLKLCHKVTAVDFDKKIVKVLDIKNSQELQDSYDYLVIATGAEPKQLAIDHPNIFYLHTIPDADRIKMEIKKKPFTSGVLIGLGYIGLEMVEAYWELGVKNLTLIGPRLIYVTESQKYIREELEKHKIRVILGNYVKNIEILDNDKLRISLKDEQVDTDFIQMSIGVIPNTTLFKNTRLKMEQGAIVVDEFMRTNIDGVFAAGDCATSFHNILNENVYLPLAPAANKQGRIAGKTIASEGTVDSFSGIFGTSLWKVFNLYCGRTGISEQQAFELGIQADHILIEANEVAHYYPNMHGKLGEKMSVLLVFDVLSHKLLGAEITSPSPIGAKKIDVLATALAASMTIEDLQKLDLGYHPSISPVWDPILVAANVAQKKLK
ncbi:MAG: FAD-dependent oxidoreductase [Candidatus Lokiarchaeota archaeon]|nr:FAD-dependent oxidoreductase [Candidatus Lokiarchaeota archaeon]